MSKLNIWGRRSFSVWDLFDAKRWKSMQLQKMKSWNVPVIAAARYNQWVAWYYEVEADYIDKITVSCNWVWCWSTFYHDYEFTVNWDAIVLLERSEMSESVKKYISAILDKLLTSKYSYEEKCSADKAKSETIMLPVDDKWEPDRDYMENYIKEIEDKSKEKLKNLKSLRGWTKININNRRRFHLYDKDLFDIDAWTKLDKIKMKTENPSINFVGRANANNWVTVEIDRIKDIEPYPSWYMTLSLWWEYLGSCFIQNRPFYTSQNVVVLKPKFDMTDNVKRFIATMIFKEWRTYYKAFVDELNRHVKTDFSILLPVDSNWNIDWNYMDNFMENKKSIVKEYLSSFF